MPKAEKIVDDIFDAASDDRNIAVADVNGNKVTVYGHEHTLENLEDEEEDVLRLMEAHDHIGMEGAFTFGPEITEGFQFDPEELSGYSSKLTDMAEDCTDELWNPDVYNGIWHNLGFLAIALGLQANVIYDMGKMLVKESRGEEYTPELNRRHFLSGVAIGGTSAATGVLSPIISRFGPTEDFDKDFYPLFTSYADSREVYAGEGLNYLAEKLDGDILYISGKAHANSIAGYTEDDLVRETKLEAYDEITPEWEKTMNGWKKDDENWILDTVVDLSD